MGFFGIGRAKWRHKDPKVRLAAVQAIPAYQESLLMKIALTDAESGVRATAATKIANIDTLRRLLATQDPAVRQVVRERLAGVAFKLVKESPLKQCADLLEQIDEQGSLSELCLSAADAGVRAAAFAKWMEGPEPSQALLSTVAIQDADGAFASKALERIAKRGVLKDIAKKAKREDVRKAAHDKAEAMDAEVAKPSAEKQRRARASMLEQICERAQQLSCSTHVERAWMEFADLQARWRTALNEFKELEADKQLAVLEERFRRYHDTLAERRREWEAQAEQQARDLEAQREREHLRQAPAPAPAPIDPELLAVVEKAEQLAASTSWRATADEFKILHKRLLGLSAGLPANHALPQRFDAAYDSFKERRRAWRKERDADYAERLAAMEQLVHAAEALAAAHPDEGALPEHFQKLKQLQQDWKRIGPVRPDQAGPMRDRFRAACDQAFIPVKQLREAEDWERFTGAAKAEELIDRVAALQSVEDLQAVARSLKQLQNEWKALANLPRDKSQALWLRFKEAGDAQYARCREYFAKLDEQRAENMRKKEALLAELEMAVNQKSVGLPGSVADLQAKAKAEERVQAIQAQWKEIGPVPREHDQAIWSRYRELGDRFYAAKRALREREHEENLGRKEALCAAVEQLAETAESIGKGAVAGDIQRWIARVREFQAQWKELGHVPMKSKEAIWERFRAACDRIYAVSRSHHAAVDQQYGENLKKKQALLTELEGLAAKEKPEESREETKKLQNQWRKIGPVPYDDEAAIEKRWQDLCGKIFASD